MNYVNCIDTFFAKEIKKERIKGHHPSGGASCLRQLYWKWNDEKSSNPPDTSALIKMKFGDLIHEFLQKKVIAGSFPDAIFEKSFEWKVPDLKFPIVGSPDVIIPSLNEGIEIKSAYGMGIRQIKENGPKPEHILQASLYHEMTGVPSWEFVYIARDNSDRVQFHLDYKQETVDKAIDRFKALEKHLEAKTLPNRDFKVIIAEDGHIQEERTSNKIKYKSMWQCLYCSHMDKCWAGAKPSDGIIIPEKKEK
jgi:hypothetical protein